MFKLKVRLVSDAVNSWGRRELLFVCDSSQSRVPFIFGLFCLGVQMNVTVFPFGMVRV